MQSVSSLDRAGRRRSPATLASFHEGRAPHNKGLRYPPDPPTVEEIIAVMHSAGDDADGVRLRALIIVLWRAGLRISEALALAETDLDPVRGAILVRLGKGGKRREVGMDRWAWEQLEPWIELRDLPTDQHSHTAASPRATAHQRARSPLHVATSQTPQNQRKARKTSGKPIPLSRNFGLGACTAQRTEASLPRSTDHAPHAAFPFRRGIQTSEELRFAACCEIAW